MLQCNPAIGFGSNGEFRKVFEAESTKSDDGDGMQVIGWNRGGTKLMAELGRFARGRTRS